MDGILVVGLLFVAILVAFIAAQVVDKVGVWFARNYIFTGQRRRDNGKRRRYY